MSTQGNRDYRPEKHYTPPAGWINDPNGLTYENGTWHLFAQHYPDAPHYGPMHWVHATSEDLLHWEPKGIALYPDPDLGMIFSGSAVIDSGNTSGLGEGCDPMILMYTTHGIEEQQCIAFSQDRVHFTPYPGNPVLPNPGQKDFRDPKVFRNEQKNCWGVVIAAGDHVDFYASEDLIHWRKTGEFGAAENRLGGVFECPDLFPLTAPDGRRIWVLFASMALPAFAGGHRMQYFLGEFDGETFRETCPADYPRIADSGYDDYAAVTFAHAPEPVMLGWGTVWAYASAEPTNEFCGLMTYARKLKLVNTDAGLMLSQTPIAPKFELQKVEPEQVPLPMPSIASFEKMFEIFNFKLPPLPPRMLQKSECTLPGELFCLHVEANEGFALSLLNEAGERLDITFSTEQQLVVDRTRAGRKDFHPQFETGLMSVTTQRRMRRGRFTMDLFFDRMICEIFADDGTLVNTTDVFPEAPYTRAVLTGKAQMWVGKPL